MSVATQPQLTAFPVEEIARQFGTPTWAYHAETIEKRIGELKAFDVIRYAQKASSNLAILKLMRNHGVVVDAVSAGEIERALRVGYTGQGDHPGIVFTADIFDEDALQLIEQHNIPVNVGSPDMIEQLGQRGINVDVTIRVNPGFGHGHSQKVNTGGEKSKHGVWHTQIKQCLDMGAKYNLNVHGLHMHIGSGTDFEHLAQVCDSMVDAARTFGQNLRVISAGGGLPIPYRKDNPQRIDLNAYHQLWDKARKQIEQSTGHPVTLEVEPGRYLVAESCSLITQIRSIKQSGDTDFLLIDAGFSDLVRPAFYGAYHHISIVPADGRPLDTNGQKSTKDYVVAGPLCESCDVFTQEDGGFVTTRKLPQANVGDYLVLHDAGAYGSAMSSNYNTRKLAAEVLSKDGQLHVIRKRQTFDHLLQNEQIPNIL